MFTGSTLACTNQLEKEKNEEKSEITAAASLAANRTSTDAERRIPGSSGESSSISFSMSRRKLKFMNKLESNQPKKDDNEREKKFFPILLNRRKISNNV